MFLTILILIQNNLFEKENQVFIMLVCVLFQLVCKRNIQFGFFSQELLVEEITSIIKEEAVPLTFDGDTRFLNFSTFGRQAPTFISIVRDPLDPRMLHRSNQIISLFVSLKKVTKIIFFSFFQISNRRIFSDL